MAELGDSVGPERKFIVSKYLAKVLRRVTFEPIMSPNFLFDFLIMLIGRFLFRIGLR